MADIRAGAAPDGHVRLGILLIVLAMVAITINDMTIKGLSGGYPLHQMVFIRSSIGLCVALVIVQFEGGFGILKTRCPGLHTIRAVTIVIANMAFFAAIAALPLALATGVFFVAPLFITLLSVLILGETVGKRRLAAVAIGLVGVAVITGPGAAIPEGTPFWVLGLPILAALCYALMQVLTAKLGRDSRASAMSVYIHVAFLAVSAAMYLGAGDGRYAAMVENQSLVFLLRAWVWPAPEDIWKLIGIGLLVGFIGYGLSQAYRLGPPATLAPFEYVAMPMAIFWGWWVFGEVPAARTWIGSALIAGAGVYVFWREGRKGADPPRAGTGARR